MTVALTVSLVALAPTKAVADDPSTIIFVEWYVVGTQGGYLVVRNAAGTFLGSLPLEVGQSITQAVLKAFPGLVDATIKSKMIPINPISGGSGVVGATGASTLGLLGFVIAAPVTAFLGFQAGTVWGTLIYDPTTLPNPVLLPPGAPTSPPGIF